MKTGTLTHVPDTFNSGIPSIFRLSFRSFCSSSVSSRSSSTKDPACGITLNAMVRGKDDGSGNWTAWPSCVSKGASSITDRTCVANSSTPTNPAPETA